MILIKAKKLKDAIIKRNIIHGKSDLVEAEEIETSDISDNLQIVPNNKPKKKRWYEKPFGIVLLMIIAGLIVAFLVYCFGWH